MITAVIPNYNHGHLINRSIAALVNQKLQPSEIIIIDDASTDSSLMKIEKLTKKHPNIRLIKHEKNQGVIRSLNHGLKLTTTEYVYFGAADDETDENLFLELSRQFKEFPESPFVCAEARLIAQNGKNIGTRPFAVLCTKPRFFSSKQTVELMRDVDNLFLSAVSLINVKFLDKNIGFDETLGPYCDAQQLRRLAFHGGFVFVPQVLGTWHVLDGSYSQSILTRSEQNKNFISQVLASVKSDPIIPDWYHGLLRRRLYFSWFRALILTCPKSFLNLLQSDDLPILYPCRKLLILACALPTQLNKIFALAIITVYFKPFKFRYIILSKIFRKVRK